MNCYFATNREIQEDDNGNETIRKDGKETAGDNLRFGTYDLEQENFNLFPEPSRKTDLVYSGSKEWASTDLKGSTRFFKELYESLMEGGDALFFIHGFNTDLGGVKEAFKRLAEKYGNRPESNIKNLVIFTWPGRSPAIPLHYRDDKEDARRSGAALSRVFEMNSRFVQEFLKEDGNDPCGRRIHLMAHSMGNRVLKNTLLDLKERGVGYAELFNEILLVASDVEYGIFEEGEAFHDLIDLGERVHIYHHDDDRVLDISKYTKNFSNRLGKHGRRKDSALRDVFEEDVSQTKDDEEHGFKVDYLNHWYYYTSTPVVDDINKVLGGGNSEFL